mgnify:FL=1
MKFRIFCAAVVAMFAIAECRGIDPFPSPEHATIPASVRSSPGGYRSHYFWHSGFHGGK